MLFQVVRETNPLKIFIYPPIDRSTSQVKDIFCVILIDLGELLIIVMLLIMCINGTLEDDVLTKDLRGGFSTFHMEIFGYDASWLTIITHVGFQTPPPFDIF